MSEEEITINYLVYETEADAIARADIEGSRRNYSYHTTGSGTRYKSYPKVTADGKYALVVDGYDLTEDEESSIQTNVTFPDPTEV